MAVEAPVERVPRGRVRSSGRHRGRQWLPADRAGLALVLVALAVGLLLGLRDIRTTLFDDAAITMRYAQRISDGHGWTYNNGDRTNGASAPLYTMVLALMHLVGFNLEVAAKTVAVVSFTATFGLAAWLGRLIGGVVGGTGVIVLLAGSTAFRTLAESGMESGFACMLGLLAIVFATTRREWLTGVVLGLAVLNKLDAGFLAVALAIGFTLATRRLPWRMVVGAGATFAPWAVFATLYFGSPLPHSASEKLDHESNGVHLDHSWVLDAIRADHGGPVFWLAGAGLVGVAVLLRRGSGRVAGILLACVLWPALHILAFSYLNFGGEYPWYVTVVYPPLTIAAAASIGLLAGGVRRTSRQPLQAVAVLGSLGAGSYAVIHHLPEYRTDRIVIADGHQVDSYEAFELTRKEAGIYLGEVAAPGDVIDACFGWPEYEAPQATIKEACPLSTRKPVGPPRWVVDDTYGAAASTAQRGFHLARSFESADPSGGSTQVYERTGS